MTTTWKLSSYGILSCFIKPSVYGKDRVDDNKHASWLILEALLNDLVNMALSALLMAVLSGCGSSSDFNLDDVQEELAPKGPSWIYTTKMVSLVELEPQLPVWSGGDWQALR